MKKTPLYNLDVDIYEETLDNGLRVFVIPKCDVNNIYATFSTNYGSIQNEFVPIGEKEMIKVPDGVAHFLEHKVFEQKDGTDAFNFFSKTGTECNANTSNNKTTYLFVGQNDVEKNLNFLLDFVGEPYFTDENVLKEKGIIEQEIKMYNDDPDSNSYETIVYNSFVKHPIKIPIGGTVESIYKITKEDLYTCYNTFYHPKNMFVVVTGNVDPEKIINIVKENQKNKKFEELQEIKIKEIDEPDEVSKKEETKKLNITIPKTVIAYKINIENTNIDYLTLNNFINIYFHSKIGSSSILLEKMKQEGLVLKDISFSTLKTDKHLLVLIEAEPKNKKEFIKKIDEEIKSKTLEIEEFNRKKKIALSSCIYMSDNIFGLNSLVMNSIINEDKIRYDIYDHYKNLDYNEFEKFINNISFDNKSILYIEPK